MCIITIQNHFLLYYERPVELADKTEWNYQVKTTGESLSGDYHEITELLKNILKIIDKE